jgi:hypothetical protein
MEFVHVMPFWRDHRLFLACLPRRIKEMAICTKISAALIFSGLLVSAAQAGSFPACTKPAAGAGDCLTETPGVGGCTNLKCCEAVCAIEAACCTDEWGLDCVVAAGKLVACEPPPPCPDPFVCPPGASLSAEPCDETLGAGACVEAETFPVSATVCGTLTADEVATTRDVDRLQIDLTSLTGPAAIALTVNSAFPILVTVFDNVGGDCSGPVFIGGFGSLAPCPLEFSLCVDGPSMYYARLTPLFNGDTGLVVDPPALVTCATPNGYSLAWTVTPGSTSCVSAPCPASDITLTQNVSQDLVDGMVACVAAGPPQTASFNNFARSYNLATGATAGAPFFIECVQVGVEANTGVAADIEINVWRDSTGGAPDIASLTLLGSEIVTLGAGLDSQFVSASFDPCLTPPVNSTIVAEMAWDANPDTAIFPGGNTGGQTATTYILSDDGAGGACAITEYTSMADIGFPDQAVIVNVHGSLDPCTVPCIGDIGGPGGGPADGTVNGFDLAILLGQWTGAATYSPCPPLRSGDLGGSGGGPPDCRVNGFDLAILLGNWGPC